MNSWPGSKRRNSPSAGRAWERRWPSPSAQVRFQWANRYPRHQDPFFWLSLIPLIGALGTVAYGLVVYPMPKLVSLGLLLVAGAAIIGFLHRWSLHYENFSVTDEGLLRAFPQRETPGIARLFPLLLAWSPRPRLLRWTRVAGYQRVSNRLYVQLREGGQEEVALRPLRLVRGKQVLDVGPRADGSGRLSEAEALQIIEREIRESIRRAEKAKAARSDRAPQRGGSLHSPSERPPG
jgi:hypothetical protein